LDLHGISAQLEGMFAYLQKKSLPLSRETYEKLSRLSRDRLAARDAESEVQQHFDSLFGNQLVHGLRPFDWRHFIEI
jgi:hypothetical protein